MKESARARRLKRHLRRNQHQGKMNLVSLMDIFTILVFFLMVNSSSDVQVLTQNDTIKLPDSTAEQPPGDVLALTVTDGDILVNGRPVVKRAAFQAFEGTVEPALKEELEYQARRSGTPAPEAGRPITILADRELPYALLKKIMSTCVDAGYAAISLAVNQRSEQGA
ncbi:RNA polymerase subunit sigma-70 [Marinobacter lutaoensis]|uniref:RNA polymerase subunit sigma-70 n=1 Tax=Marinobacter lutaoensis TaxID=135739 RepID=A0A1V2DXB4_9GAMM|nr:biopolymer transporter ExbD [Marinobacter lutaoensis]ONF45302.1 RNA polymerase subunit sigma-70 [Marinobacter lutaoensis]